MIDLNPVYIAARRVLLDALDALHEHREAVILVGAQAVYLQARNAEMDASVAPFTADADLGLNPLRLGTDPRILEAMSAAGFSLKAKSGDGGIEPGTWLSSTTVGEATITVPVDLLVPEALSPAERGRRDARLPEHGKNATRWTPGLEPTVIDNTEMVIASLEPDRDPRTATIRVAGPGALLVSKAHKITERLTDESGRGRTRVKPKDAGDIIRLMTCPAPPSKIGAQLATMAYDEMCGRSVRTGVEYLERLFGGRRSPGVELAIQSLAGALSEDFLRALAPNYIAELLDAYRI